jgi:hypothetical protein
LWPADNTSRQQKRNIVNFNPLETRRATEDHFEYASIQDVQALEYQHSHAALTYLVSVCVAVPAAVVGA